MSLIRIFYAGLVLLTIVVQRPAMADAASGKGICPSGTSLFGTIRSVSSTQLLVKTVGRGFEYITTTGARIHTNNLALRPGVFVGAYGCFTENFQRFRASELTLSYEAGTYPANARHIETLQGTVVEIHSGRVLIQTGKPHGFVNIIATNTPELRVGDNVRATGYFNPDASFTASAVESTSADTSSTTIRGIVREIHTGTLLVQTGPPHGFVNVVTREAAGVRVGDRVTVSGSFNPNKTFQATQLVIQHQ